MKTMGPSVMVRAAWAAGIAVIVAATPATTRVTEIIDASGDGAGNGLDSPSRPVADAAGNVFVSGSDSDNVFRITPAGAITEIVDATGDGVGNVLEFPGDPVVDGSGNVFVPGGNSDNVFKVTPGGTITEVIDATGDGGGNTLDGPVALAVDGAGNLFVAARRFGSNNVFKVTPGGSITQILDATGDGGGNLLDDPRSLHVDAAGNVFAGALLSDNVFRITPGGTITEIIDATGDGAGNALDGVQVIAGDSSGNVFVVGGGSSNVFRVTPGGAITEIIDVTGDGAGHALNIPSRIAVDATGNVFVHGTGVGAAVFKITPGGSITAIIDSSGDGAGNGMSSPLDVAVDGLGNAFVVAGSGASSGSGAFKITPGGVVTEIIDLDGDGAGNGLARAAHVAVDPAGNAIVGTIEGTPPPNDHNLFKVEFAVGCPALPAGGCAVATTGRLLVVQSPSRARNRVTWKWGPGPVAPGDFGDPLAADDYLLCLYAGGDGLVGSASMPAGGTCGIAPCWKGKGSPPGSAGYRYKNRLKTPDGVSTLNLTSRSGTIKLAAKGYQLTNPGSPRPTPVDLLVQLQAGNGQCWEASFSDGGVLQNAPRKFKAKAD
jgi:hypothetical protein